MLTALGIGATIGAGIFVMPGRIAEKAGPAGILSFMITGFVFLFVGICYERFAAKVPHGVSASQQSVGAFLPFSPGSQMPLPTPLCVQVNVA